MRRNELLETTALAPEATASSAAPIATTTEPETKTDSTPPAIDIPEECAEAFIAAVEIGYYKEFYRQGLITADELDILLQLQKKKADSKKEKNNDLSAA